MNSALSSDTGRMQRSVLAMISTLALVALADVTIGSALSGQLRLWFPVWIDPGWETPGSGVVYSQSYIAGIVLLLPLLRVIERELTGWAGLRRVLYWAGGGLIFAFLLWWKGGLMVSHDKELEALLWLVLGGLGFLVLDRLPVFPEALVRLDRKRFLSRLALALVGFFWVMAVVDPVLQVGVHGLPWSPGLIIEVGFFVPAGALLLVLSRRLATP